MSSFTFVTPACIVSAPGALDRIGELASKWSGRRVLLVTDRGLVATGIVARATERLTAQGFDVQAFDGVESDPSEATVLAAARLARDTQASGVIGIGGGSSLDVAKLVALLAGGDEKLADIYGVGKVRGPRLPLILVPTTAGTGSEVTTISIVTVGATEKLGVVSPVLLPDVALLDASLTLGLPPHLTAATGIDAMVHAIEAFTSIGPNANPVSRHLAIAALKLLGANIRRVVSDGSDLQAREAMLLGSMLAGQSFANAGVGAVHALAYPLGSHFHVAHGLSNALVLPHVMRFNARACAASYAELAPVIFPHLTARDDDTTAHDMIDALAMLAHDLGLATQLRDVGVAESDLAMLAGQAMRQQRLLVNNVRAVNESDALSLYRQAW